MRVFVNGRLYDSVMTPIIVDFDVAEAREMNLNTTRIASIPGYIEEDEMLDLLAQDMTPKIKVFYADPKE